MKSVHLFMAALLLPAAAYGNRWAADSVKTAQHVSLDEVVVIATKAAKGTPVAYSDLSKDELARRNDGQGIPCLISQTPSVIMTSDAGTGIGYSGFRIRGTDANRINITVNGVPVNDAESHGVFWVNMPDFASSVENIQIQRGVGTSTNGAAAFGATVAMQTANASMKPSAEYAMSAGSFGTVKHMAKGGTGLLADHFVFDARYSDIRSDGFIDRASARMSSYFMSAAWYGDHALVKFQTFGSSEKTYQAWTGVPSAMLKPSAPGAKPNRTFNPCGAYEENGETRFYNNQTDNYWQEHYHLMASRRLGSFWTMNLTLHYTPGSGYYEDYKAGATLDDYKLPGYTDPEGKAVNKTDLVRRKWLDNDFYGGIYSANYRSLKLQLTAGAAVNKYAGRHFGQVVWAKSANALPLPGHEYYRNKGEKLDYSAYLKAIWLFHPDLNGYADLQYRGIDYKIDGSIDNRQAGYNVHVDRKWDFFNPKAGLNYRKKDHNAFVSVSVANREPNRDNFTQSGANEHPVHETLYDYEAGYAYRHKSVHAGANLYYMDYRNQLILSGKLSEIGEPLTSNIKDSYRMGLELTGGISLARGLTWNGNVSFSRNRIKDFTEFIDDWDNGGQISRYIGTVDIAYSPDIVANSAMDLCYGDFSATFHSQYVGRQYVDNTSAKDRSVDPYFVSGLRMGYVFRPAFMKEIALDITLNNLFNEAYETNGWAYSYMEGGVRRKDDGYFTQAGINAMARMTLRF
ncbi:MAG: TonB-dependent receptor plug domain-containing protein [Tannerellaceae bacterium]|jgi:iron complex outermembrane receptor protein|nr:TonB-dependent receptor plug domain-containing protein [Tannerellaceae bacterium]